MTKRTSLTGLTFTLILLVGFIPSLNGQERATAPVSAEKRALMNELFDVTQLRKTADEIHKGIMEQQRRITKEVTLQSLEVNPDYQELSDENREKLRTELLQDSERVEQRVGQLMTERIDLPTLIEEISYQLYDKYFTVAELKDLVAFYRSPTGKKAIEIVPKLFSESMELARVSLQPKMAEVITILSKEESERVNKELKALKAELEPAKPAPAKRRTSRDRKP